MSISPCPLDPEPSPDDPVAFSQNYIPCGENTSLHLKLWNVFCVKRVTREVLALKLRVTDGPSWEVGGFSTCNTDMSHPVLLLQIIFCAKFIFGFCKRWVLRLLWLCTVGHVVHAWLGTVAFGLAWKCWEMSVLGSRDLYAYLAYLAHIWHAKCSSDALVLGQLDPPVKSYDKIKFLADFPIVITM